MKELTKLRTALNPLLVKGEQLTQKYGARKVVGIVAAVLIVAMLLTGLAVLRFLMVVAVAGFFLLFLRDGFKKDEQARKAKAEAQAAGEQEAGDA